MMIEHFSVAAAITQGGCGFGRGNGAFTGTPGSLKVQRPQLQRWRQMRGTAAGTWLSRMAIDAVSCQVLRGGIGGCSGNGTARTAKPAVICDALATTCKVGCKYPIGRRRQRWGALLLVVGVPLHEALTFHVLILESMGDEVVNDSRRTWLASCHLYSILDSCCGVTSGMCDGSDVQVPFLHE